jgi:hypothetical protein
VTTPANWKPGDDVVVHAGVPTEEARKLFPNLVEHKVSASRFQYWEIHTDKLMSGSTTSGRRRSLHKKGCNKVDFMEYCVVVPYKHMQYMCSCLSMETRTFVRPVWGCGSNKKEHLSR